MTDPTPNGQTWVCGWTDVGANCLAGDPCDPETCGYRPVPPAPSSDERAPFADLTDEEFAVFAEGAGFDPALGSDTPSDERHAWKRSGPWDHTVGPDRCICGKGWPCPDAPARPAPSTPVPEASGRPGEMVFTQGSPRPALQVLVSLTDGRPCVDAVSMLAFFRDSAAWNEVAGDPEKVAGLRAAADAMWELHGKAKAHLHDPAPSSSPVPEASGEDEVQPTMHILRRADGEEMGEFAFWATDGPDGWDMAEDTDHDEDTVYEILACYPVARRKILWSTLCETCDGEGDGCPACAGSGECEPPDAEHMPIIARPAPSPVPEASGRPKWEPLTLREAAIEAILIREQDTAFSVVARHIAALFTSLDAIPSAPPVSSEASGRAAPTPFETFQAGMAAGLLSTRHALIHDYTEDEVRQEFRDWLDERAADRGEPTP